MKKYKIALYKKANKKIINEIVKIAQLLTENWFTKNVPSDISKDLLFHNLLCLKINNKIVSFIIFTSLDGSINITLMGTHPEYMNKGLGTILLNNFCIYVSKKGSEQL